VRRLWSRFTVRQMAVAIAVIAIALASGIWLTRMGRLAGSYQQRAHQHVEEEREARRAVDDALAHIRRIAKYPEKDPMFRHLERLRDKNPRADYHAAMKDKYELASRRPWQPVTSDPPPP
jgi:hypothetical protein